VAAAGPDVLTPRETEVLAAVGRRLSNAEIAEELHLSVRTVESHIAALRRKLAADTRAALVTAAASHRAAVVQVPRNSFVGRDRDLVAVRELLDRSRWVTLVGPGGCGKTRLALELAARDGRVPVVAELEHARDRQVATAIAKAIGLGVDGSRDVESACAVALQAQPYVLVLDNVDRVAGVARDLVGRLLTRTRSLVVLTTSRAALGASDETVYPLEPLSVDGTADAGAVRLFLDRARTAAPVTAVTADDVDLVARICHRLDGLPLAIELAAARVRHLSLPELASRLDADFDALDRVAPDGRHRTLATAFDWTLDLLDDDERSVLSRLAALPRTFDLDLAEAVTTPGAGRVVLRLLDRSLVSPAARPSEPQRFRLLQPLRAYLLERTDRAVVQEVRRAHASHYAAQADLVRARARTDDSREAAARAAELCPEVNAALDWALGSDPRTATQLACALAVGGEQYGPDLESVGSIGRAARDPRVREVAGPAELLDLGIALCYGDLDLVRELAEAALDRVHDSRSELAARHLAGYSEAYRHSPRAALTHLEKAEALAQECGDTWQLASVRQGKGIALRGLGLHEAAISAFESAMHAFALAGDAMHVNNARYMMAATVADLDHRSDAAVRWAEQCADYARRTGNQHELAHAELTTARLTRGPVLAADLAAAVDTFRAVGDLRCLSRSYLLLAEQCPPGERAAIYEQAFDVASAARDQLHQERALDGLIRSYWSAGERHRAATALGRLVALVGREAALRRCPEAMLGHLDEWSTAVAEGRARQSRTGQ
jgi:predicted ATPase/DNA-binding CsgD family transcriptional regulator